MDIGANPCPGNMAEGDAIHLVPGSFGVSTAAAAAKRRIGPDIFHHLYARTKTESLEKIFVQQTSADQGRVERRQVAEVSVVHIEFEAFDRLHTQGSEASAESCAGRSHRGIGCGAIRLDCAIEGEEAFVVDTVFEKDKGPIDAPFQHVHANTRRAGIACGIEAATLKVYEHSANFLIRVVAP